jgi:hypothetical protein
VIDLTNRVSVPESPGAIDRDVLVVDVGMTMT